MDANIFSENLCLQKNLLLRYPAAINSSVNVVLLYYSIQSPSFCSIATADATNGKRTGLIFLYTCKEAASLYQIWHPHRHSLSWDIIIRPSSTFEELVLVHKFTGTINPKFLSKQFWSHLPFSLVHRKPCLVQQLHHLGQYFLAALYASLSHERWLGAEFGLSAKYHHSQSKYVILLHVPSDIFDDTFISLYPFLTAIMIRCNKIPNLVRLWRRKENKVTLTLTGYQSLAEI